MSDDSSKAKHWWRWPREQWGVITGVAVSVLSLYAPLFILAPFFTAFVVPLSLSLDSKQSLAQLMIAVTSLLMVAGVLALYKKKFKDIGFVYPYISDVGLAILGFMVYFVGTVAVGVVYRNLLQLPDQAQNIGYHADLAGFDLFFAGFVLLLLVPIKEEIIFRGFLFKGLRWRLPFWLAALGTSILFGAVHGQWNVGLDVFVMSMVSCYLVEKTGSLWPSIFLHIIKNAVAFYVRYLYNG